MDVVGGVAKEYVETPEVDLGQQRNPIGHISAHPSQSCFEYPPSGLLLEEVGKPGQASVTAEVAKV